MADHDPLCSWPEEDHDPTQCTGNLARVRADEQHFLHSRGLRSVARVEQQMANLRAKVEERLVEAEQILDPHDAWLAMAYREVLRMIKEARDDRAS